MIDTGNSWLIQRLLRAPEATEQGDFLAKARQVFGGAALGLGDDALALLRNVFAFDNMGAAEYEFGKIPKVLGRIAKEHGDYVAFMTTVVGKEIKPGWWRESRAREDRRKVIAEAKAAGKRPPRAKKPVYPDIPNQDFYVLCHGKMVKYACDLIQNCAAGKQGSKNGHYVELCLDPEPGRNHRDDLIGWLELDHGILFFRDKQTWEKTRAMLDIQPPRPRDPIVIV